MKTRQTGNFAIFAGLIAAEKWNGELPRTQVPGSAVPFLSIPRGE